MFVSVGFAQETSVSKIPDQLKQKKFAETGELTDNELRIKTGSLSRYSLTLNLGYEGPVISDLSAQDQPNPDRTVGNFATNMKGGLGGRYRWSSDSSVTLTSGVAVMYPMGTNRRYDLSNQTLTYDLSGRLGEWQSRMAFGLTRVTVPELLNAGQVGGATVALSLVREIPGTSFSLALNEFIGQWFFERPYRFSDGRVQQATLVTSPELKYTLSPHFTAYTAVGISHFHPRSARDDWALHNRIVTQRLGIGYGYSRDIYFSPYVKFYPGRLTTDTVTLNFSTVISGL